MSHELCNVHFFTRVLNLDLKYICIFCSWLWAPSGAHLFGEGKGTDVALSSANLLLNVFVLECCRAHLRVLTQNLLASDCASSSKTVKGITCYVVPSFDMPGLRSRHTFFSANILLFCEKASAVQGRMLVAIWEHSGEKEGKPSPVLRDVWCRKIILLLYLDKSFWVW